MDNKYKVLILVLIIILMSVSVFNVIKKNSLATENTELKKEISSLEEQKVQDETSDNDDLENNDSDDGENENEESEEDEKDENTFEEDIEWFFKNLYTDKSKEASYNSLKDSATEDLLKSQFGSELPPEDNEDVEKGVDNDIENMEIFGKYSNDSTYKALVKFDIISTYEDKEDTGERITEVTIEKDGNKWLVSDLEDKAK